MMLTPGTVSPQHNCASWRLTSQGYAPVARDCGVCRSPESACYGGAGQWYCVRCWSALQAQRRQLQEFAAGFVHAQKHLPPEFSQVVSDNWREMLA